MLSLLDIEQLKARERQALHARRLAEEVLQAIDRPLAVLSADGRLRSANHSFVRLLGLREEAVGRRLEELVPKEWDGDELRELFAKETRQRLRQIAIPGDGGPPRRLAARRIEIEGDEVVLLAVEG
ncbi:MAG TPA: PAS domain-containing protein [Thermoanaerobaculia bacterium]|nr:PAS domain-containing protein [Thermoanaerobaculia bacterium]